MQEHILYQNGANWYIQFCIFFSLNIFYTMSLFFKNHHCIVFHYLARLECLSPSLPSLQVLHKVCLTFFALGQTLPVLIPDFCLWFLVSNFVVICSIPLASRQAYHKFDQVFLLCPPTTFPSSQLHPSTSVLQSPSPTRWCQKPCK